MDFGRQNGGKLVPKWHQKSMSTSKGPFYKKPYKTCRILMIFGVSGAKLGAKIDQKSIKKWRQQGKGSEHRFLIDFCGFWRSSWEAKWRPNGPKRVLKIIHFQRLQKCSQRGGRSEWGRYSGGGFGGSFKVFNTQKSRLKGIQLSERHL